MADDRSYDEINSEYIEELEARLREALQRIADANDEISRLDHQVASLSNPGEKDWAPNVHYEIGDSIIDWTGHLGPKGTIWTIDADGRAVPNGTVEKPRNLG